MVNGQQRKLFAGTSQYCLYLSVMVIVYVLEPPLTTERGVRLVLLMTNITFSQFDDKITKVDQRGLDKITQHHRAKTSK